MHLLAISHHMPKLLENINFFALDPASHHLFSPQRRCSTYRFKLSQWSAQFAGCRHEKENQARGWHICRSLLSTQRCFHSTPFMIFYLGTLRSEYCQPMIPISEKRVGWIWKIFELKFGPSFGKILAQQTDRDLESNFFQAFDVHLWKNVRYSDLSCRCKGNTYEFFIRWSVQLADRLFCSLLRPAITSLSNGRRILEVSIHFVVYLCSCDLL